ncbi:hypothetical protein Alg130_02452 [Pyrenophora tritici-repentis]|nr:hypothetical protein Alg130_02452 [Pyrenophora tritici-repentis]KAI0612334.1 hypothetical protein TUN205_03444 [Pyrenophora tritici-repentis]KAI1670875.1 hypothetical protein L13192_04232 [Pyrenophora tritici-repentis]
MAKEGNSLSEQVLHAGLFVANHYVLYSTASVWLKSRRMPPRGPGFGYGDRGGATMHFRANAQESD